MFRAFEFCIPTAGTKVPTGPEWLHEIKYDGFRLRAERDGDRVRLIKRGGYDWTKKYPWIAEAASKSRRKRCALEALQSATCAPVQAQEPRAGLWHSYPEQSARSASCMMKNLHEAPPKVDPAPNSNTEKDPDEWVSDDEPMTGAQAAYLKTLSEECDEPEAFAPDLTKPEASKRIDALKAERRPVQHRQPQ